MTARDLSAGVSTVPKKNCLGSIRDAAIAKSSLSSVPRSFGGSPASLWTENTGARESLGQRSKQPLNPSGNKAVESSRPTQSYPKRWLLFLNGFGSEHLGCFAEPASSLSLL